VERSREWPTAPSPCVSTKLVGRARSSHAWTRSSCPGCAIINADLGLLEASRLSSIWLRIRPRFYRTAFHRAPLRAHLGAEWAYPTFAALPALDGSFFIANIPRPLTPAEQLCTPCAPGQVLDLSTTFSLSATGLFFNPEGFGRPAFGEGQLTYTSAPVTVPVSLPGSLGFGLQFPLTATGFIRIIDSETSVLIDNPVVGSGRGLLFLTGTGADVPYSFSSVNYSLADPVPEPGSLLLTSLGALYLARQVRRRRRDGVDRSGS
jgi:hypothetical protein